jgi:hypothetical protein
MVRFWSITVAGNGARLRVRWYHNLQGNMGIEYAAICNQPQEDLRTPRTVDSKLGPFPAAP